jgi:allantoicase
MPLSRQSLYNRRRGVEALQQRAADAPLVVSYEGDFVVRAADDAAVVLKAARYEVIGAWIDGFVAGRKSAAPSDGSGSNPDPNPDPRLGDAT